MAENALLQEARKLHQVSDNLDLIAEQHGPISTSLALLSGSVRRSATLLEVLVAVKLGPPQD